MSKAGHIIPIGRLKWDKMESHSEEKIRLLQLLETF